MKPIDSYSAINKRLNRRASNEVSEETGKGAAGTVKASMPNRKSTIAEELLSKRPSFNAEKVATLKAQIASGAYFVDLDLLAAKILDAGVLAEYSGI
tara:strand:+ start:15031 stop:15321 length:291 start_codon:yes stop_codon:yes gene_type:complete